MHTRGVFAPESAEEARELYDLMGPAAQVVLGEIARAMDFDREEYERRVTPEVVATARDALFASLLEVTVGTREEYEAYFADDAGDGLDVVEVGSENVDNVVWHAVPFAGEAAAATFQDEERAAVETLRRQAFGRIYRNAIE